MPSAIITTPRSRITLDSQRLQVRTLRQDEAGTDSESLREIPLRDLDRIVLGEDVSISSPALTEMLRRDIPVSWLDARGRFLGSFQPVPPSHGSSRLRQYQRTLDTEFALRITGRIVVAKIYNQRRVLQRIVTGRRRHLQQRHDWTQDNLDLPLSAPAPRAGQLIDDDPLLLEAQSAVDWLDGLFNALQKSTSIDEARGYEGAASARYFKAWAGFLPTAFPFERRSTRPPQNPVNACISFGASFVYNEMTAAIHAQGLDPALGFLHQTENGRWSLALDLMEPFRPVLVEALALDLFSHAMVGKDDFEARDGGIYLNAAGRRKFVLQYERRMDRQFMSESVGHRTTLRQQLDHQVTMLKSALDTPEKFEPFLIN
jgi:CRISPR-associated protein Cas1